MSHCLVTGAQGINVKSGGPPNRLEINDFMKNEKFFSLYVQALANIQERPQSHPDSLFQVAGIHGLPYVPWGGSGEKASAEVHEGYCTHSSVLFPTWHRAYVMLFEQTMQAEAIKIADTYTVDADSWKKAATEIRQPYWDWAINVLPPPEVILMKRVDITGPDGERKEVSNPLFSYEVPENDAGIPSPTTRDPMATMNSKKFQSAITMDTYNLFALVNDWDCFSNNKESKNSISDSLEAIHDTIHNTIGGHMRNSAIAGFDPIFWMHHAQIDRLLSMWSAVHPGVWVTEAKQEHASFSIPPGTQVDANTPLTPFRNTQTSHWTSSNIQTTQALGYSYPEFDGLKLGNTDAVQRAISKTVNNLYGDAPTDSQKSSTAQGMCDWTARVQFKQHELGESFDVLLFLGTVPDDPKEWCASPNLVGCSNAFVNSAAAQCGNCQREANTMVEGFVHLNKSIASGSGLGSLDPTVVAPYLTNNLHWRVQKGGGQPAEVDSLEVVVMATPLSFPRGAMFPVQGKIEHYRSITSGRKGGARSA